MIKAYHFTDKTLRHGSPIPTIGQWIQHQGQIVPCQSGLHASVHPFDALEFAPGPLLHRVTLHGEIIHEHNKIVGRSRRIDATIDATDMLMVFARKCALNVSHLWDCPIIVKHYLQTGDESIRDAARAAARAAAMAAAFDAAWAAARAAACAAAWDAARAAQRNTFAALVDAEFAKVGF
jgi:hypothetical protein